MTNTVEAIHNEMQSLHETGTYKHAPVIDGPMGPTVRLRDGREVVNLCSNNYLGLANDPEVVAGAKAAVDQYGQGTASVRFICGTFSIHEELEAEIAEFFGFQAATTYVSCWCANEALVPTLLSEGDAVVSDSLNHASIIDACRLCGKNVRRVVYQHNDMADLAAKLEDIRDARRKLIITDGVFSMEGDLANLPEIVKLAKKHDALVAVDDSHAHGVLGNTGRGTAEHFGVKVDILTGTLGKALGGAAGGFIAAAKPVIELMTQRSRPQLFSNALPPATAGGALAAIRKLKHTPELVETLRTRVAFFREELQQQGFNVLESPSAIVPVIVGDTAKAIALAKQMLSEGVMITGFGYPVVPEGTARLRAQISATHTREHLQKALGAFESLRKSFA
ncbi:MAG: glycine C-acetyltransferase [Phycisphaerae bacterium]|nr:glycine C-acetyltransferase [Phycisphaerae bacterium]